MSCRRALWLAVLCALVSGAKVLAQPPAQPSVPENVVLERDVEYGKAGQRPLTLDLLRPKEPAGAPLPAIVMIHGGGWQAGKKADCIPYLVPYATSGNYVGVTINYRLSQEAVWPAQIHDCKAAIRWLKANAKKYNIDPDRVGVMGASAGGHLVSLLGTSADVKELEGDNGSAGQSTRVACVVDLCGPSDLRSIQPEEKAVPPMIRQLLGGTAAEKPEAARSASPIVYVNKNCPPFLLVHGTSDRLVPFEQATSFCAALKAAGIDATLLPIEGGGHDAPGKPESQPPVRAFFDKHLRGK